MAQITKTHSADAYAIACDEFDSSLVDGNIGTLTVNETAELIADLESVA